MSVSEKAFTHPILGEYIVTKRKRSKSVRITIRTSRDIRVSIPYYASYNQAIAFLESKTEWIKNSIEKQRKKEEAFSIDIGPQRIVETITGNILISKEEDNHNNSGKIKLLRHDADITIKYNSAHSRDKLALALEEALRIKAKAYLPQRTSEIAAKYGFTYNKIFIKKNRSNWGSCSSLGNINLNLHLVRMPSYLCDYIIIHELVHLKHRNHGRKFHEMLNSLTHGKSREFSLMLKNYRPYI